MITDEMASPIPSAYQLPTRVAIHSFTTNKEY